MIDRGEDPNNWRLTMDRYRRTHVNRDAAGWRTMKRGVTRHDRNAGSITAADFILGRLAADKP